MTLIPDVQSSIDSRHLPIDKVGIKSIRHPVKVLDKSGGVQHTIATFNMYVGLPHNFKGTHMSRFVEILNSHEREISVENFPVMLRDMIVKLDELATLVAGLDGSDPSPQARAAAASIVSFFTTTSRQPASKELSMLSRTTIPGVTVSSVTTRTRSQKRSSRRLQ